MRNTLTDDPMTDFPSRNLTTSFSIWSINPLRIMPVFSVCSVRKTHYKNICIVYIYIYIVTISTSWYSETDTDASETQNRFNIIYFIKTNALML